MKVDLDQGGSTRRPIAQLQQVIRERKIYRVASFKLYQEYLKRLAEEEAGHGKITKSVALRRLKEAEATRKFREVQ
jgi:hypothetical protein